MSLPRTPLLVVSLSLLSLGAGGCAGPIVERSIESAWIGSDRARLSIYMGCVDKVEEVPADIPHEVVRDDAMLTRVTATETCFDVSARTSTEFDEPIEMLTPTCSIDGEEVPALVSGESVKTAEYSLVFRVNQRSAEVCCPGAGRDVKLRFHSPRMQFNNLAYGETFAWRVL